MSVNKKVIISIATAVILSGCGSTEKKQQNVLDNKGYQETITNPSNDASTQRYQQGSNFSTETFDGNNQVNNQGRQGYSYEFNNPNSPLSTQTIYFMYDSSQIRQDFIPVIAAHVQYLLANPYRHIILEGHADERGSREYNIALGEQRAKSVYTMMRQQGVPDSQLEVVSYGEEKPASESMNAASWQLNRRVNIAYQE